MNPENPTMKRIISAIAIAAGVAALHIGPISIGTQDTSWGTTQENPPPAY